MGSPLGSPAPRAGLRKRYPTPPALPRGVPEKTGLLDRALAPYRAGFHGFDRRVFWIVGAFFGSVAARMSLVTFLGIFLTEERGLALTTVGFAFLLENVCTALVGPFGGALSDRVGRKPVILGGMVVVAIVLPTFLLVDTAWKLVVWSVIVGSATGFFRPASISLLLDLVPKERRQSALALNYTAVAVGYSIGVAPAGFLAAQGYGALALASGLGYAIVLAMIAIGIRGPVPREARAGAPASFLADATRAPRDPAFLAFASLAILFPLGIGLVTNALPIYSLASGLDATTIGIVLGTNGLILAVLSIPANVAFERFGPFRLLPGAAALVVASYVIFSSWPSAIGVFVGLTAFSLGEILFSTALPTAVASLAPAGLRGAYQGAWGMIFSLGAGSALIASGALRDAIGWRGAWLAFAIATAIAGVALALARGRFRAAADARAGAAG